MSDTSIGRNTRVYLSLGSNIGIKESNLARALKLLPDLVTVSEVSSIYESEPVGLKDQPWFVNVVCAAYTDLSPSDLLAYLKHIEGQMGRIMSFKDGPRIIDIDILFYGDQVIDTPELTIPHPRIPETGLRSPPPLGAQPSPLPSRRVPHRGTDAFRPQQTRKGEETPVERTLWLGPHLHPQGHPHREKRERDLTLSLPAIAASLAAESSVSSQ